MHTSARASVASPRAVPTPAIIPQSSNRNFLADVRIEHGPHQLLSRMFLRGDTLLRERGINLQFAPIEALLEVNRQNQDSWRALFPVFNPELGAVDATNSFALIGREASGRVIAAQGARLYRLGNRTFKQETDSMRLYYPNPARQALPGESCVITAPTAERLTGDVIFSGAVWYHPDYRRKGLTSILPRITKALSLTRWGCDTTLSFMVDKVVEGGTAPRAGYQHVEWDILMKNTMFGDARLALIWSNADELIQYFSGLLVSPETKVDTVIDQRPAHNNTATVAQG